jgi:hypothetical protein
MTPPAPEQAGLTAVEMARAGRFADICDLFAPQLRSLVSADTLQAGWDSEVARLGPITSVGTPVTEPAGPGLTAVKIPVTGENGALTVIVAVTADGWLAGVQLAAASAAGPAEPWQPPPYADPRSFDEQEVTVGSEVRQISYLASLNPQTAAAAQPVIDAITRQAALVDSPDLSPSTPPSELPLGTPAPYWLDLRGYDPVGTAAALNLPLLIVQGGRDYQATVADDLARWQAGLAGRPDVTIMVYEPDNHLFFPGSGPSSPAEYEAAQHVDPAVVADVAGWLLSSRGEDQVR